MSFFTHPPLPPIPSTPHSSRPPEFATLVHWATLPVSSRLARSDNGKAPSAPSAPVFFFKRGELAKPLSCCEEQANQSQNMSAPTRGLDSRRRSPIRSSIQCRSPSVLRQKPPPFENNSETWYPQRATCRKNCSAIAHPLPSIQDALQRLASSLQDVLEMVSKRAVQIEDILPRLKSLPAGTASSTRRRYPAAPLEEAAVDPRPAPCLRFRSYKLHQLLASFLNPQKQGGTVWHSNMRTHCKLEAKVKGTGALALQHRELGGRHLCWTWSGWAHFVRCLRRRRGRRGHGRRSPGCLWHLRL